MMKFSIAAAVLATSSLIACAAGAADGLVSVPVSQLKWTELAGSGGIQYANVRGDLTGQNPYEAFVLFPAGRDNPTHHHSKSLPTVVIQGTFYAVIDGKRTEYPAGSFYDLPAGKIHESGCVAGMDCLLYQYQSSGFDFVTK